MILSITLSIAMEENIIISNLNDFIFCPRSVYFHNLYSSFDDAIYYTKYLVNGKNAHESVDEQRYSTKRTVLQGIDIYSEELGVVGKIDIFDVKDGILTERKNKINKIYEGYLLQLYAQYFCLVEMGYNVKKIRFYSFSDNKTYDIQIPGNYEKDRLKEIINNMRKFKLEDKNFSQNINKCRMCIYKELCDYYKGD